MMRLSPEKMAQLPAVVARPAYDPAAVTCGILHLGVGSFHRAHQAAATEAVLAEGAVGWGVAGVSLRRPDQRNRLELQRGLYTLTVREAAGLRHRVIGGLREIAVLPEAPERVSFAHLRNVSVEPGGAFEEAGHLDDRTDMVPVIRALTAAERATGQEIPFRSDHGHLFSHEAEVPSNPGYSDIARLRVLTELRGICVTLASEEAGCSDSR